MFRERDWDQYGEVNDASPTIVQEAQPEDPIVLVQDYHFALLPRMIRKRCQATIITFWHIPWPNSETFGICPWREENHRRAARQTILGFPHPVSIATISSTATDRLDGKPDRSGAKFLGHAGWATKPKSVLSDFHRMAACGARADQAARLRMPGSR